jgi:hypothetical protein
MKYHLSPGRMAIINKTNSDEDVENRGLIDHRWDCAFIQPL